MSTYHYGQVDSLVSSDLFRATEGEDIRITEDGDIRITGETRLNLSEGLLRAEPTKIRFISELYHKSEGVWKQSVPYIKYNGSWVVPDVIYKRNNGAWQRVY